MFSVILSTIIAIYLPTSTLAAPSLIKRDTPSIPGKDFTDDGGVRAAAAAAPVWLFGRQEINGHVNQVPFIHRSVLSPANLILSPPVIPSRQRTRQVTVQIPVPMHPWDPSVLIRVKIVEILAQRTGCSLREPHSQII